MSAVFLLSYPLSLFKKKRKNTGDRGDRVRKICSGVCRLRTFASDLEYCCFTKVLAESESSFPFPVFHSFGLQGKRKFAVEVAMAWFRRLSAETG